MYDEHKNPFRNFRYENNYIKNKGMKYKSMKIPYILNNQIRSYTLIYFSKIFLILKQTIQSKKV